MDKTRGYVRNWRAIEEWQWYTAPNHAHVFQHLIRKANHKDGYWQGIEIMRGQCITSQETLAIECGVTRKSIRTILHNLSATGEIVIKRANERANSGSIISICNYDSYQSPCDDVGQPNGQPEANEGPTKGQRRASNNNPDNPKNPENKEKRARFAPPSPQEVTTYGESIGYTIDGQGFCDFYASKGWLVGKSPMKDWKAAVRTWKKRHAAESPPPGDQGEAEDGEFHIPIGPTPQAALDLMDEVWPLDEDGKPVKEDSNG